MTSLADLPNELCVMISELSMQCENSSNIFKLQWIKQSNIIQACIYLNPTHISDAFDMDCIADAIRNELAFRIPQAMPFSIDRINGRAKNLQLRTAMNEFVTSMHDEQFVEHANRISNEMTNALCFTIKEKQHNVFTETICLTFRICRSMPRSIPSKAFIHY